MFSTTAISNDVSTPVITSPRFQGLSFRKLLRTSNSEMVTVAHHFSDGSDGVRLSRPAWGHSRRGQSGSGPGDQPKPALAPKARSSRCVNQWGASPSKRIWAAAFAAKESRGDASPGATLGALPPATMVIDLRSGCSKSKPSIRVKCVFG